MASTSNHRAESPAPAPTRPEALAAWSRGWLPLWGAVALYGLVCTSILVSSLRLTGGRLVYPLDDPYITMAMAKHLALGGVWGVTPFGFTSSCSSPGFLVLLAALYRVIGPNVWAPLLLSWSAGLGSIFAARSMLHGRVSEAVEAASLAALVLLTPLFVVGTLGMEHSLHLLLSLLLIARFERLRTFADHVALCTVVALTCAVRYEGLLMVAAGVAMLLAAQRWRSAAAVVAGACAPVAAYAAFSLAHGGALLPNSVLLKGLRGTGRDAFARVEAMLTALAGNLMRGLPLFALLIALIALIGCLWAARRRFAAAQAQSLAIAPVVLVAGATALHLLLADVGWAFRYEDYLIGCAAVVIPPAFCALIPHNRRAAKWVGCLLTLAIVMLGVRAAVAAGLLPRYSQAVFLQQQQTADFLARYYPQASIAAGDVGLINFRADLHCLDLTGLASASVFNAKRAGSFTTQELARQAQAEHVQIAVVYDTWFTADQARRALTPLFGPALPAEWARVGRWTVPETLQLGDRTVSFYAVDPAAEIPLRQHLLEFRRSLPPRVAVEEH